MSLVDAELSLQMKIFEAARKLCDEDHPSKAVRKSRIQQCKREEKKLKRLQETAFQLRLEHGRSSPLPAFNIAQHGEDSLTSYLFDNHLCMESNNCLFIIQFHRFVKWFGSIFHINIKEFVFVLQIWVHLMTVLCLIL